MREIMWIKYENIFEINFWILHITADKISKKRTTHTENDIRE